MQLTDINPATGNRVHVIIRINRPGSEDYNPPHKDFYEQWDALGTVPEFINFWIPICGVTSVSSLPVAPAGWGPMTRIEGERLVRHAWERGIRFFDTAAGYGDGLSEEILGDALGAELDAKLCTKAVLDPISDGFNHAVVDAIDGALRRLRRDQIAVFLLHGPRRHSLVRR